MTRTEKELVTVAALGVGAVLFLRWLSQSTNAADVAQGATNIVGNATAGVITGIGQQVGIPPTDPDKCTADLARGDTWNASFDCPAGTFIKSDPTGLGEKLANLFS